MKLSRLIFKTSQEAEPAPETDPDPVSASKFPDTSKTRIPIPVKPSNRRLLLLAQGAWILVVTLTLIVFVTNIPNYFAQLQTVCTQAVCSDWQLTPDTSQSVQQLGLSLQAYALLAVSFNVIVGFVWFAIGLFLFWRKTNTPLALLMALMLVTFGAENYSLLSGITQIEQIINALINFFGNTFLVLVFYVFPNGRFVPRWTRWFFGVGLFVGLFFAIFPPASFSNTTLDWVYSLSALFWGVFLLSMLVAQVYRYRRVSNHLERQQTKWVVSGIVITFLVEILFLLLPVLFEFLGRPGSLYGLVADIVVGLVSLLIPLSVAMAVLRYRLWDIDVLISRSLVYLLLTAGGLIFYALGVGLLGRLFDDKNNALVSLVVTGIIAVFFQPVSSVVQRWVNRLMYGERDDPYRVMSRLGSRLESTLASDAILPSVVEITAHSLKSPYVAIELKESELEDVDSFQLAAAYGTPTEKKFYFPLVYQNETVGQLVLAPRSAGEEFSAGDKRLLNNLARQAGVAAYAVQVTQALQRSRERLVLAREEERRRLRRDLHDGLGPTLAGLNMQAGALLKLIPGDPEAAAKLVEGWRSDLRATTADIRRLVYELRPPALDELGLVGAIQDRVAQFTNLQNYSPLTVHFEVPAEPQRLELPAAIEVAVYRIVQEALNNVVRHAEAHSCWISLGVEMLNAERGVKSGRITGQVVRLEISDDGIGVAASRPKGVGLVSMRERAEELGGTLEIKALNENGEGTRIVAVLPVPSPSPVPLNLSGNKVLSKMKITEETKPTNLNSSVKELTEATTQTDFAGGELNNGTN